MHKLQPHGCVVMIGCNKEDIRLLANRSLLKIKDICRLKKDICGLSQSLKIHTQMELSPQNRSSLKIKIYLCLHHNYKCEFCVNPPMHL